MVQQQPGDRILGGIIGGQVDPFQLAPAMPWESPLPFVPRYLAKQMWPQGFQPFQQLAAAIPPAAVQPPAPANQVVVTQPTAPPAQPAPRGYRPAASGGEPIGVARSQRIRIRERPGL